MSTDLNITGRPAQFGRGMSRACPDTLAGLRDRALLLLGFTMDARTSELAALANADLTPDPGRGLVVRIAVIKNRN